MIAYPESAFMFCGTVEDVEAKARADGGQMSPLNVTLLSLQGLVYEGEALEVYFPTTDGPLGVLPGHTPFIAELAPMGVIRLKETNGNLHYFAVSHGAVEVRPDKTIALSDLCLSAPSEEEARALLKKGQSPLQKDDKDFERARAALEAQTKK
jgi:F-type H+-transporting ATPase subunit epsilon